MNSEPLIWVSDDGEGWNNRVISNAFECDMDRIISSDMDGFFLSPGIYRIVRVDKDEPYFIGETDEMGVVPE